MVHRSSRKTSFHVLSTFPSRFLEVSLSSLCSLAFKGIRSSLLNSLALESSLFLSLIYSFIFIFPLSASLSLSPAGTSLPELLRFHLHLHPTFLPRHAVQGHASGVAFNLILSVPLWWFCSKLPASEILTSRFRLMTQKENLIDIMLFCKVFPPCSPKTSCQVSTSC